MPLEQCRVYITRNTTDVTLPVKWFLQYPKDCNNLPVDATVYPLINGQAAFSELHKRIDGANRTIEIAIWGFQPSMFFERDGVSPCIGDLLIQKALGQVKVKVLVWSMSGYLQTFKEPNLGAMPGLWGPLKDGVTGETAEQKEYDYYWYKAVRGDRDLPPVEQIKLSSPLFISAYKNLLEFAKSDKLGNLQYKNRKIGKEKGEKPAEYDDKELSGSAKLMLPMTASHHQKTVLIDYEDAPNAIGFVLEHNMLDNYWDTNAHPSQMKMENNNMIEEAMAPWEGRNTPSPYQDVSALVTGQVLWHIEQNFCESWNRNEDNFTLNKYHWFKSERNKKADAEHMTAFVRGNNLPPASFSPNSHCGIPTKAQILRTYDKPEVEDIKRMYLSNIIQTTSFIYTENQYFRWPPLVDAFIEHWQNLKEHERTEPIHWFVVTNASDEGVGSGAGTMDNMLKRLGRQDVLPKMSKSYNNKTFDADDSYRRELERRQKRLEKALQDLNKNGVQNPEQIEKIKRQMDELEVAQQRIESQETEDSYKTFYDTIGIKAHICTLTSMDTPPEAWNEVYVHSKVSIIDDVFLFIGSANLNTRAMQVDTELGVITECKAVAQKLRKDLWALHTGGDEEANPDEMVNDKNAEVAFKRWEKMMEQNKKLKSKRLVPNQPLCEFYRDKFDLISWD
ncbi:hypothetical protein HYE60_10860 [Aggregatibacter actinomycetemcomitans]|uniref:phospholipase D-like domain-containing protein n=1 Tax=Aggregatibacter actinomycetemcomitans TaxID=714 RepID=UPI001D40F5B9|nr:phospholipase D-like domain-containing protein [Aggregatibacter actinomycetemcomitans]MBN6073987.1 hypothetical protein [Aggregatibacter actinomycetemcomitans]MBN6075735.1 hypothetical protein [Aggregatibacter actinomycetemcomitans]